MQDQTGGNLRGGARRFSALTSVALRAPSVSAERKAKPDRSCAIKTGHFNVLPTVGKLLGARLRDSLRPSRSPEGRPLTPPRSLLTDKVCVTAWLPRRCANAGPAQGYA